MLAARYEVEDDIGVGEVADLRAISRREPSQHRKELGRAGVPLGRRPGPVLGDDRTERLGTRVCVDVLLCVMDDLEGSLLALRRAGAPGGDAVATQDHAD